MYVMFLRGGVNNIFFTGLSRRSGGILLCVSPHRNDPQEANKQNFGPICPISGQRPEKPFAIIRDVPRVATLPAC